MQTYKKIIIVRSRLKSNLRKTNTFTQKKGKKTPKMQKTPPKITFGGVFMTFCDSCGKAIDGKNRRDASFCQNVGLGRISANRFFLRDA